MAVELGWISSKRQTGRPSRSKWPWRLISIWILRSEGGVAPSVGTIVAPTATRTGARPVRGSECGVSLPLKITRRSLPWADLGVGGRGKHGQAEGRWRRKVQCRAAAQRAGHRLPPGLWIGPLRFLVFGHRVSSWGLIASPVLFWPIRRALANWGKLQMFFSFWIRPCLPP